MTCDKCQSAEATIHVTDRGPSNTFQQAHYCETCGRDLAPPSRSAPYRLPTCDDLARALIEAAVRKGEPVTEQEAHHAASLFYKMFHDSGPSGASPD